MFYITIILIANILTVLGNLLFFAPCEPTGLLIWILLPPLATVALFAIDGITAFLIRRFIPERFFLPSVKCFEVKKQEKKFYKKLKITAWADKVPELGGFTDFHKDKLTDRHDLNYLERFLIEANYGVVIHLVNGICGFLIFLIPKIGCPSVAIPTASVNLFLALLPVAVLRYNAYSLKHLYDKACTKK